MSTRQRSNRQPANRDEVQTQRGRAAVRISAARIFLANERMNQMLIEHLDPAAWKAKPPGKTRTIAAVYTHMHNMRAD